MWRGQTSANGSEEYQVYQILLLRLQDTRKYDQSADSPSRRSFPVLGGTLRALAVKRAGSGLATGPTNLNTILNSDSVVSEMTVKTDAPSVHSRLQPKQQDIFYINLLLPKEVIIYYLEFLHNQDLNRHYNGSV